MKTKQASLLELADTSKGQVEAIQVSKTYDTGKLKVQALKVITKDIPIEAQAEIGAFEEKGVQQ